MPIASTTFQNICGVFRQVIRRSPIPRIQSRYSTSDVIQEGLVQIVHEVEQNGKSISELNTAFFRNVALGHLAKLARSNLAEKRSVRLEVSGAAGNCLSSTLQEEDRLQKCEQSLLLLESMGQLTTPQKDVIIRRYFEERTFDQIAADLNVTVYRVRELHSSALETMRTFVNSKA